MFEHNTGAERAIRAAFDSGRLQTAAQATLLAYGYEIRRFLYARLPARSDALEVYSMFTENLWTGLPAFEWRCSMRTWSYTLARNASLRYLQAVQRDARRHVPWPHPEGLAHPHETPPEHRQELPERVLAERFEDLRQRLDREAQELLALRVDGRMAWRDLASVRLTVDKRDDESITREAARLRKAFERIKVELRQLAKRNEREGDWQRGRAA